MTALIYSSYSGHRLTHLSMIWTNAVAPSHEDDSRCNISRRMRSIALQSAIGGMALSLGGSMIFAGADILLP